MKKQKKSEITKVIVILSSFLLIIGLVIFACVFSKLLPNCAVVFDNINTLIILLFIFLVLYVCLDYCFKSDHELRMKEFYSEIIKQVQTSKQNEHSNDLEILKWRFAQKMLDDYMRNDHELKLKASEKGIVNYHLGETFIKDAYRYIANGNGSTNMDCNHYNTNSIPNINANINTSINANNNPNQDPNNNPNISINNPNININNSNMPNEPNTPNTPNTPTNMGLCSKTDELKTANDMLKAILDSNKVQTPNTPNIICLILNGPRKNLSKRKKK